MSDNKTTGPANDDDEAPDPCPCDSPYCRQREERAAWEARQRQDKMTRKRASVLARAVFDVDGFELTPSEAAGVLNEIDAILLGCLPGVKDSNGVTWVDLAVIREHLGMSQ